MIIDHRDSARAAFISLTIASGDAVVTDLGTTAPPDFLAGYTGDFSAFVGMGAGDEVAQSVTLAESTTLGSIILGYREFDDGGRFATANSGALTIRMDAGNDGSDEITETVSLDEVDFSKNRFTNIPTGFGPLPYVME